MKNFSYLILVLISFVSCNKAKSVVNSEKNNTTISYYNAMVNYIEKGDRDYDKIGGVYFAVSKSLENTSLPFQETVFFTPLASNSGTNVFEGGKAFDLLKPTQYISSTNDSLSIKVNEMVISLSQLREDYNTLKSYIESKEYEVDKGEKVQKIVISLEKHSAIYETMREEVIAMMKPIVDEAEKEMMLISPLKEEFLASKSILEKVDENFEYYSTTENMDLDLINTHLKEINALIEKAKSLDTGTLETYHKATNFKDYCIKASEYVKEVENAFEDTILDQEEYDRLSNSRDLLIQYYNSVVS